MIMQLDAIANRISDAIGEHVEMGDVQLAHKYEDCMYTVYIRYDGTDDKGHEGKVYFNCQMVDTGIEDFVIVDIVGSHYFLHPCD